MAIAKTWFTNIHIALPHLITHNANHLNTQKPKVENDKRMEDFRVPLHYPRYRKEDYAQMEEWMLDNLLRQYGLDVHVKGSLDEKRKYAMGAFLWPDQL
ncbi:uncharacterized protein LOC130817646 [Amaranthus tricolor]|uniref:uncharacterized protein LOC130817646 n=1 Tax=Amaranthus tricolor TaxID=29722 RepID=UPI002587E169|nr:uncharacterized protein LOC130817646 [Amaranthus tricolor]